MAYNPYELDERWEYELFTEVLPSARYPVKKKFALIHSHDHHSMGKIEPMIANWSGWSKKQYKTSCNVLEIKDGNRLTQSMLQVSWKRAV